MEGDQAQARWGDEESPGDPMRWESLAGLALLVLVVGFALFTWISSALQDNAYSEGIAAAERKDWDVAVSRLSEAGDHPSAIARLAEARGTRDERDRLYQYGAQALERRSWQEAAHSLRGVLEIQPGYRDSAELLARAELEVANAGTAGIVYLVGRGPQSGLYLLGDTGERHYLPGSDGISQVRAISPQGDALAYDSPTRADELLSPGGKAPDGGERTVAIIRLRRGGSTEVAGVTSVPGLNPKGVGVFSSQGLWWYSARAHYGISLHYFEWDATLQGCDAPCVTRIHQQEKRRVVALDPPRSRTLLVVTSGTPGGLDRRANLYLAGPRGENPMPLYETQGDVYRAAFSPDGRWIVYMTQEKAGVVRRAWVAPVPHLETASSMRPRQLTMLQSRGAWAGAQLTAAFLPSQEGQTFLAVSRRSGFGERLTVYGLQSSQSLNLDGFGWPSGALQRAASYSGPVEPGNAHRYDQGAFSHGGLALASRRQRSSQAWIEIYSDEAEKARHYSMPIPAHAGQAVSLRFAPRDDYLVANISNKDDATEAVYLARINHEGRAGGPQLLTHAGLPISYDMPTLALPAAGTHIVYVSPTEELRARAYTDTEETVLAENVTAVWNLRPDSELVWWR